MQRLSRDPRWISLHVFKTRTAHGRMHDLSTFVEILLPMLAFPLPRYPGGRADSSPCNGDRSPASPLGTPETRARGQQSSRNRTFLKVSEFYCLTLCGHLQPNDGSTVDLTASIRSCRDDTKFHQMCCARLAWCRFAAQRGIRPDFASRWE